MASFQFACPHCSRQFKVEQASAGKRVKCPGCGNTLEIPDESPAATSTIAPPIAEPSVTAAEADAPIELDFLNAPDSRTRRRRSKAASDMPRPVVRQLSRTERARRRRVRSFILAIVCLIILLIAAAFIANW